MARERQEPDPVLAALRKVAELNVAHDQMHPASAGWRELLAALPAPQEAVEVEMRESGRGHHNPK